MERKPADQASNTNTMTIEKTPPSGHVKGPTGAIYYDDGGQGGLPVVFLHAFGGSTLQWQPQLNHLRKNRRAIALDLRGHGQSDTPSTPDYAVESLTGDIAAVVDSLRLERFVLVGHSMGGIAAIAYAGAHPQRVAGLVMAGTPGKSSPAQSQPIIASLESDAYEKVMEAYMQRLLTGAKPAVDSLERAGVARFSKETNIAIIKAIFQFDLLPALQRYPGPKLLITTPQENQANALGTQVPGIPQQVITGTSHWTQLDKPEDFNRILDAFLETVKK